MKVLKVRPVAWSAKRVVIVFAGRRLDLDDVGAPIGKLAHRCWTRANARQIEDANAGKRSHVEEESATQVKKKPQGPQQKTLGHPELRNCWKSNPSDTLPSRGRARIRA